MDNDNNHQNDEYDSFYSNFSDSNKDKSTDILDKYNTSLTNTSLNNNNEDISNNPINNENNEDTANNTINNDVINNSESKPKIKHFKFKNFLFKSLFAILFLTVISIVVVLVLAEMKLIKLPWIEYPEILNLSQNELMLKKDSNYQFSTYVYPSQVKYGKIIFESSNPDIADINPITGYVEAKQNGVTTIKAYLEDYNDIYDTCDLVVSNSNVLVERMEIEHNNVDILVGNTYMLKYSYYPKNAGLHYFNYTSSDPSIITVNSKGEVQAIKSGKAVVNILEEVSGQTIQQEFTVHAKNNNDSGGYIVSSIKLSTGEVNLNIGGEYQVIAKVYPEDVSQKLSWTSLDESVVKVTDSGLIKAIDYGNTKVLATAIDGTNKIINVNVQENRISIKNIGFSEKSINMQTEESKTLHLIIDPEEATDRKIEWTTSSSSIVSVDSSGTITGVNAGNAIITATTSNGIKAGITVNVTRPSSSIPATNIILSKDDVTIKDGSSINIEAAVIPNNASNKKLTWSSSNDSIATVSNGMIYGKSPGKAAIIVTTSNNITKYIKVTVNAIQLNSISLNQTNLKLGLDAEAKLYVTFKPANASDKRITWASSDSNIASVDNSGLVKAKNVGTVTITAKSSNGLKAECKVKVTNDTVAVSKLALSSNKYIVKVGENVGITPIITPSNATNQKVSLIVSNSSIAEVQSDGTVKGLKEGIVELTARSHNGKVATSYIIVKNKNSTINYLDGSTIKYWYDNTYGTYAITHIWVKDAYNQFKSEIPDKFGTLANPNTLTLKAAKKNPGKTLISVNASSFVTDSVGKPLYAVTKEWKYTSVSPIVIYEGNVLRDYTSKYDLNMTENRIYGVNKNNQLYYYTYSKKKSENTEALKRLLDDGIRYTFSFRPVLLFNSTINKELTKDNNIRQSICQIDNNNFLYITNISSNRSKGFSLYSLANKMIELGCKTGFNLDGGGSASIYYVPKDATVPTKIRVTEGSYGRSVADIIYFVGD